jgi:ABC-type molybdate transport system ATPase subunit
VRVELVTDDGEDVWAQVTRGEAEDLALEPGTPVFVRAPSERVFEPAPV